MHISLITQQGDLSTKDMPWDKLNPALISSFQNFEAIKKIYLIYKHCNIARQRGEDLGGGFVIGELA